MAVGFLGSSLFLLFCSFCGHLSYSICCPLFFFFFSVSPFLSIAHCKCKSTTKVRFSRWVQWAIHPWSIHSETFSALRGLKFGTFILYLQDISVNKKRMSFSPTNHCNQTQWKKWQWPPWPKFTHFFIWGLEECKWLKTCICNTTYLQLFIP